MYLLRKAARYGSHPPPLEETAQQLISGNQQSDPDIEKTYWFPDISEVRLVHVYKTALPNRDGQVRPFYFSAIPEQNILYRSAIALIRPEEDNKQLRLPEQWGAWHNAKVMPTL